MNLCRTIRSKRMRSLLAALLAGVTSTAGGWWPPAWPRLAPGAAVADVIHVYDDLGRLRSVVDGAGNSATYRYDAVGNLMGILQGNAGGPSIALLLPAAGTLATMVTIWGAGFSAIPADNVVTFNGVPATVRSSTPTRLVVGVPVGATTGPVTVTTSNGTTRSASAFTVTAPDLGPTVLSAPATGGPGVSISVSWTVSNQGSAPSRGAWTDVVYLSTDAVCCVNDAVLERVPVKVLVSPARTYTKTQSVRLPTIPAGQYYLILRVDAEHTLAEADEDNNQRAIPITIAVPDLVPTAFTAPDSITTGQGFSVSWTVANQGASAAPPSWVDGVYLAAAPECCDGATRLAFAERTTELQASATYSRTRSIPELDVSAGNYYLILVVDSARAVAEAGEDNNRRIVPLTVLAPDLVATALTAPASAAAHEAVSVSWTVANQGNAAAAPRWTDAILLSTDPACCHAGDTVLGTVRRTTALPAGDSYTQTRSVTLPGLPAGTYYLFVDVDSAFGAPDADRSNNRRMLPIAVTTPDLVATDFAAPASAKGGTSVSVSWTAANQGTAAARSPWNDSVYLSAQPTCCSGATLLGTTRHAAPLAAGGAYAEPRGVVIPKKPAGSYYLIIKLDAADAVYEADEANNQRAVPFTISP
jgi:YD repeat-containing protein